MTARHRPLLLLVLLLLLLLPRLVAADMTLITPDGPITPGKTTRFLVVLHEDGAAIMEAQPTVAATPGDVTVAEGRPRDGLYAYHYRAPADARGQVTFTIGTGSGGIKRVHKPIVPARAPLLRGPDRIDVVAGTQQEVSFFLLGEDLPAPDSLALRSSEGRFVAVKTSEEGLQVTLLLGEERFPRVVLVGAIDLRHPERPPTWVPIRIVGRPRIPVRTEPGARVTIEVGSRVYGPFEADAQGIASAAISAWPGEETASVTIEDALGNIQHSTLNLQRETRPLLMELAAPARPLGAPPAPIFLAAQDTAGNPWRGGAPRCSLTPGGHGVVTPTGPGRYLVYPRPPEDESFLDLRMDCELPGALANTRLRLPMGEGIPDRLLLRVYPAALSADFPVAQVQVLLEDRLGERLPAERVRLGADLGDVQVERVEGGALRWEYNGAAAAGTGGDQVWARFDQPAGDGPVSMLVLGHGELEEELGRASLPVFGRALDHQGRPLQDVPLELALGDNRVEAITGARGWAKATLPVTDLEALAVLEARHRDLVSRQPFLPRSPDPATTLERPDLETTVELPITAGRVREVFIDAQPSLLYAGPSAVARVRVRLLDRHGNAVTDESVRVLADQGEVGALRATADGTYEAWYRPPPGLMSGTIHLSAEGQEGAFAAATELQLVPRPLSRAVGVAVGGVTNFGSITSPILDLSFEGRLSRLSDWVVLRATATYYSDARVLADEETGDEISVHTALLPVVLGAAVRHEAGLQSYSLGAGFVMLGYRNEVRFGDRPGSAGLGLGGPGMELHSGLGRRLGVGEVTGELRYLLVTTRAGGFGYNGAVGGVAILSGYRVLF